VKSVPEEKKKKKKATEGSGWEWTLTKFD